MHNFSIPKYNMMKTKINWMIIASVSFVFTIAAVAKDTALWDGGCHNVTGNMDGFLKLFIAQEGKDISGYISISGWLYGSGDIKGSQDGNTVKFTSTDVAGGKIHWEGIIRDGILSGEYFCLGSTGKQVGEFKVSVVDKHRDAIPESESSFRKLFMLMLEADLNAPVQLRDGSVAFGADSIFHSIHPVGDGVSVRVNDIEIDWRENATRKDAKDIRKYSIGYTLYWHGLITPTGWTKMSLSYNANLGQITEHKIIQSTGTTNGEAKDMAFGIGVILGQAAMEAFLNSK